MQTRALFVLLCFGAGCAEGASYAQTSCSAGSTTFTPCPGDIFLNGGIVTPDYTIAAFAGAGIQLPGQPPWQISAVAETVAFTNTNVPVSASASAGETLNFDSSGSGQGFIDFSVALTYVHFDVHGASTITFSDGTHTYDFIGGGGVNGPITPTHCSIEDCEYNGQLPFDLGGPFTVSATAYSLGGAVARQGHNSAGTASFSLVGPDGVTPVGFQAESAPEPGAAALFLMGCAALVAAHRFAQSGYRFKRDWP